ncbi:MAG: alpha-N-arabinofuranosidase, partial [Planctomycetota bacterium]|nr:alpha-N-arabinofuranosidase [Planctomycetota bacterium]
VRKDVPHLAAAGVRQDKGLTIFAANRALQEPLNLEVLLRAFPDLGLAEAWTLRHGDLLAVNTAEKPETVKPAPLAGISLARGRLSVSLPPASWNAIRLTEAL